MRYGIKVAYEGSIFHGSQRQGDDDRGSVEGAIVHALKEMGLFEVGDPWPVEFSSRTDAGVSALGNVFSIETDKDISDILCGLNAHLRGVFCIAHGKMRENQNIRWANSRWYRYHLPPEELQPEEVKKFSSVLALYVGNHDFTNLCKMEEGKDPNVLIERANAIDLTGRGEMVVADIVGSRFLWNQVRRMVGAALISAKGELDPAVIEELLKGKDASGESLSRRGKIRTMPPTGLVLMDVMFKDIDFTIDRDAVQVSKKKGSKEAWEASMKVLLHTALRSIL